MISYFKRKEPSQGHYLNKANPNCSSIDSLTTWPPPKGLGHFSASAAHTARLKLGLTPLHLCACSRWSSAGTGISKNAEFPCFSWTSFSPIASLLGSLQPCPTVSSLSCSPFMPLKPVSPTWTTPILLSSNASMRYIQPWPCLDHSFWVNPVLTLRKRLPDLTSLTPVSS